MNSNQLFLSPGLLRRVSMSSQPSTHGSTQAFDPEGTKPRRREARSSGTRTIAESPNGFLTMFPASSLVMIGICSATLHLIVLLRAGDEHARAPAVGK